MAFPQSVLLNFLQETVSTLNKVPNLSTDSTPNATLRIPIDQHRQTLLEIQMEILSDLVERHNKTQGANITIVEAQSILKQMGIKSSVLEEENGGTNQLQQLMEEMNEAARTALVKLVLKSEWELCQETESNNGNLTSSLLGQSDGDALDPSDIKAFCALCVKAVSLPEVIQYLEYGGDALLFSTPINEDDKESKSKVKSPLEIQNRMKKLQHMLYQGVGYDPEFAIAKITSFVTQNPVTPEEVDLFETITDCISTMRLVFENVTLSDGNELLSDETEGGCTRVVSVKYSEKEIDPTTFSSGTTSGPPRMVEHIEETQKENLEMARQAASLQQGILGELLSLGENERTKMLEEAKSVHQSFMTKALEIPIGPERVQFLQSLTGEKQRLLVMHKLWEKILAEKGDEPLQVQNE